MMEEKKRQSESQSDKKEALKKLEKRLFKIAIGLGIVATVSAIFLIRFSLDEETQTKEKENLYEDATQDISLDDGTYLFPDNCNLNQPIPNFEFTTENGEVLSIKDYKGEITIVTFWASWCPDCVKELALVNDFLEILNQYDKVNYLLINKLDNEKETKEQAKQYLDEQGIEVETYYDEELVAYNTLGMHNIPTTYFIDEEGILRALCYQEITEVSVFEAYVWNIIKGSGTITGEFVETKMMDSEGGIHSVYDTKEDKTYESSILSESQGIMLEYAVLKDKQQLFDQVYNYISSKMWKNKLTSWMVEKDTASDVNALIDDFRIYTSLVEANNNWGGYDEKIEGYENALKNYAIQENHYVDFYDSKHKEYAQRLTLCFADFQAMSILAEKDSDFQKAYEEAIRVVTEGMISEEFPLYYSWYNYNSETYEKDEMNSAEAMITLYHLAEMDMLPQESIAWLKYTVENGGIKARYTVDGDVVEGYNYESTAIYALVAMIAIEVDDYDLCSESLKKMERMHIINSDYAYNGSFGLADGSGINSFDQVMAMLAYEYTYFLN